MRLKRKSSLILFIGYAYYFKVIDCYLSMRIIKRGICVFTVCLTMAMPRQCTGLSIQTDVREYTYIYMHMQTYSSTEESLLHPFLATINLVPFPRMIGTIENSMNTGFYQVNFSINFTWIFIKRTETLCFNQESSFINSLFSEHSSHLFTIFFTIIFCDILMTIDPWTVFFVWTRDLLYSN